MSLIVSLLIVLFATPAPRPAAAPGPVTLSASEIDTLTAHLLKDRSDTEDWLKTSPSSYLATVQRQDFEDRSTMTVGRAVGSDVRIDDQAVMPNHLRVTVVGDSFRVEALDAGASFRVKNEERTTATLPASMIGLGRYQLRLSHQRFPAIIVFDPQSPRFKEYKGLAYFPVDLSKRYVLALTPKAVPDTVEIMSTRGNRRHALEVGWFDFSVGKTACRLAVTRLLEPGVGEHDYSVFFRDGTTGKETYGVGRYVDPEPLPEGRFVVDFNNAYNPACAFSEHYNCPIPPKANRLPVAIRVARWTRTTCTTKHRAPANR